YLTTTTKVIETKPVLKTKNLKHHTNCDTCYKLFNIDYLSQKTTCRLLIAEPLFMKGMDVLSVIIRENDKEFE
ncbi:MULTISPECIES: hypothetical protein, partial [unclassified Vibrio]